MTVFYVTELLILMIYLPATEVLIMLVRVAFLLVPLGSETFSWTVGKCDRWPIDLGSHLPLRPHPGRFHKPPSFKIISAAVNVKLLEDDSYQLFLRSEEMWRKK